MVFYNRVRFRTATVGTGAIAIGAAYNDAFLTPAESGAVDGQTTYLLIEDGQDFEISQGVFSGSVSTLSRATVLLSKIGGVVGTTKVALSGSATIRLVEPAEALNAFAGLDDPIFTTAIRTPRLGVNAVPDAANPISATIQNALFSALYRADSGDGSLRFTMNKELAGDVLSFLFQRAFDGRAEFGLIGNDDFTIKVRPGGESPDVWYEGLIIDKDNGKVSFPSGTQGPIALSHESTPATPAAGNVRYYVKSDNRLYQVNSAGVETPVGRYIGEVVPLSGPNLPPLCIWPFGQNISRSTYALYFNEVSTTYGSGDGSTTFGVPDYRGRVLAGKDNMGGSSANRLTAQSGGLNGDNLGAAGGTETHTLAIGEIPAHSHLYGTTTRVQVGEDNGVAYSASPSNSWSTSSAGSGGAHNNVQPTIVCNYAIFVGV